MYVLMLCIQDTTELDYNGQAITGLGPLRYETPRGLHLHPTYIVSPARAAASMAGVISLRTTPAPPWITRKGCKTSVIFPSTTR